MNGNVWDERRRALEESFFMNRNRELLSKLKHDLAADEQKKSLSAASGITDEAVLDQLVAAEIGADALAAISLVPVVLVAWADGHMADQERAAILDAGAQEGISAGVSRELLESWLDDAPDSEALSEAWKGYIGLVMERLGDEAKATLRNSTTRRARRVAEAAGGILGLNAISKSEQDLLDDLEAALS